MKSTRRVRQYQYKITRPTMQELKGLQDSGSGVRSGFPWWLVGVGVGVAALAGVGYVKRDAVAVVTDKVVDKVADTVKTTLNVGTFAQIKARYGGLAGYIQHLSDVWLSHVEELKQWTPDKIKAAVIQAADALHVPREIAFGIAAAENGFRPVGIFGSRTSTWTSDPAAAIRANSSAFGLGQTVGTTFYGDLRRYVDFEHEDLWRPDRGATALVMVLGNLVKKYGPTDYERIAYRYTGGSAGPLEAASIRNHAQEALAFQLPASGGALAGVDLAVFGAGDLNCCGGSGSDCLDPTEIESIEV